MQAYHKRNKEKLRVPRKTKKKTFAKNRDDETLKDVESGRHWWSYLSSCETRQLQSLSSLPTSNSV